MYHLAKLKNGATVITVPVPGTQATTVLAMFPVGSRYETKSLSGAAHFLEHMLFKGTDKRPTALELTRILESVGAEFNAYTNKDYTGYYVKIDAAKQELAFDLLSDMIYHSKLEEAEVKKEKGAIVEELRMYKDNPTMAVDRLFDEVLFGSNHPMGWDIGGTPESVRAMNRADLFNFYRAHYSPKNLVLVVAGKIDRRLKRWLGYFARHQPPRAAKGPAYYRTNFAPVRWPSRAAPLSARVAVETRVADQAHLIMGFPGLKNYHPDRFAASLLITILGVGMSSRLFVEVREKRGLAYMVHAGSASYRDVGAVYIQAGLDPARLSEALAVIKTELARLTTEPVSARELSEALGNITGSLSLALENSRVQAEWYAKQWLFSPRIETPAEVVRQLSRVSPADLQRVARVLFKPERLRLALIGAVDKRKVIARLR